MSLRLTAETLEYQGLTAKTQYQGLTAETCISEVNRQNISHYQKKSKSKTNKMVPEPLTKLFLHIKMRLQIINFETFPPPVVAPQPQTIRMKTSMEFRFLVK